MKCILSNSLYAKEHNTTQSRPKLFIDERKAEIDNSGSQTDFFFLIVHDLSLPIKQVRTDSYYVRLMLVLVLPQAYTSVLFVLSLRSHIIPGVTRIFF